MDGRVELSDGTRYDSSLIVWAAGNAANPLVAKHTDLPVDEMGRLVVRADLRVGTDAAPVPGAWGAGDAAAVPDVTSTGRSSTVPNAQHAVRQGKRLAANVAAEVRGGPVRSYRHRSLGVVATLGFGRGVFECGPVTLYGFSAWLLHRGYHVLAVPTWERKVRVLADWLPAATYGRDIVSLQLVQRPRAAFIERWRCTAVRTRNWPDAHGADRLPGVRRPCRGRLARHPAQHRWAGRARQGHLRDRSPILPAHCTALIAGRGGRPSRGPRTVTGHRFFLPTARLSSLDAADARLRATNR